MALSKKKIGCWLALAAFVIGVAASWKIFVAIYRYRYIEMGGD
jgi:hypothetical protein